MENKADFVLPKTVKAIEKHGNTYVQEVEYEFVPPRCTECKCFGHNNQYCSNYTEKTTQIWVEKAKTKILATTTQNIPGTSNTKNDVATKNYIQNAKISVTPY